MVVIVWVSALVSSFIDNIPFTTAMVRSLFDFSVALASFLQLFVFFAWFDERGNLLLISLLKHEYAKIGRVNRVIFN